MSIALDTALHAATTAGRLLRRKFTAPREVRHKGWRDIVTDADLAAQAVIVRILTRQFPRHAILAEEGRHDADLRSRTPTWVIDPLDGTSNYARQFPIWCVSIALARAREVQVGVIYDPLAGVTYFAERGRGAFVRVGRGRAQRLHVSRLTDFGDAVVGVDWARDPAVRALVVSALGRVAAQCRTVRAIGSAALGLAHLAAGRLDGYYHLALQPWDVAAGALLVTEAGGRLSRPDGRAWRLGEPRVAASNRALHGEFLRALRIR
jgi:myo-inositol-1(or 4)-monophosphatase